MAKTDTDVVVTQYRAEFRAKPFARPRWTMTSGMESRQTLPRRRRWTVARDFATDAMGVPINGCVSEIATKTVRPNMLIDPDAVIVWVPNESGSRYGVAVLLEEVTR